MVQQSYSLLFKWNEKLGSPSNPYSNTYSSFICNHWKWEAIQIPLNWWMDEQFVIHHTMEKNSAIKRDELCLDMITWKNFVFVSRTVVTKGHKLDGLNNNVFSHSCGDWKSWNQEVNRVHSFWGQICFMALS